MKTNHSGKQLAIWGVVLQFGLVVGFAGTMIGMFRAFARLSQNGQAQLDAAAVASDLSIAFNATAGGMVLSLVGVLLLLVALLVAKYRAPWFRTALWILAVLWLFSIPVGTIVGIMVMLYLAKHRDEFTEPATAPYGGSAVAPPPPVR